MSEQEAIEQDAAAAGLEPEAVAWQIDFDAAASVLFEKYPEDFAYSRIDPRAKTAEIAFKGDAPGEAAEVLEDSVAVVEHVGYSEAELNADVSAVLQAAQEQAEAIGNGMATADIETRTINVFFDDVHSGIGTMAEQEARSIERFVSETADLTTGFAVSVEFSSEPVVDEEAFDGGWGLVVGGRVDCTMSFPVKKGTAAGLLTAGHCPGMGTYGGVANAFNPPQNGSLYTTDVIPGGDFRWNWSKTVLSGATYMALPS